MPNNQALREYLARQVSLYRQTVAAGDQALARAIACDIARAIGARVFVIALP